MREATEKFLWESSLKSAANLGKMFGMILNRYERHSAPWAELLKVFTEEFNKELK